MPQDHAAHHVHASSEAGEEHSLEHRDQVTAAGLLPDPQAIVLLKFALVMRDAVLSVNPAGHFEEWRGVDMVVYGSFNSSRWN